MKEIHLLDLVASEAAALRSALIARACEPQVDVSYSLGKTIGISISMPCNKEALAALLHAVEGARIGVSKRRVNP